jgi:hypothetical protein
MLEGAYKQRIIGGFRGSVSNSANPRPTLAALAPGLRAFVKKGTCSNDEERLGLALEYFKGARTVEHRLGENHVVGVNAGAAAGIAGVDNQSGVIDDSPVIHAIVVCDDQGRVVSCA